MSRRKEEPLRVGVLRAAANAVTVRSLNDQLATSGAIIMAQDKYVSELKQRIDELGVELEMAKRTIDELRQQLREAPQPSPLVKEMRETMNE